MVRHRSRKRLPALLRAIILFKLEQLSILTVCFSGTTASAISAHRCAQSHPASVRMRCLNQPIASNYSRKICSTPIPSQRRE
jgi:hypothetical protein